MDTVRNKQQQTSFFIWYSMKRALYSFFLSTEFYFNYKFQILSNWERFFQKRIRIYMKYHSCGIRRVRLIQIFFRVPDDSQRRSGFWGILYWACNNVNRFLSPCVEEIIHRYLPEESRNVQWVIFTLNDRRLLL